MLDDTLHLTVNQAALWGFGGIDQGNLDPVYETNSRKMHLTADLADTSNLEALELILANATTWLAWGNRPRSLKGVDAEFWRRAEQRVLAMGHLRQAEGASLLATKLNQPSPERAPAHASPRRFPPGSLQTIHARPMRLRIVER